MTPANAILFVVACCGLMVASVLAFLLVATFSFFGIALIGLLIWFTCTRVELEKDGAVGSGWTPSLMAKQYEARQKMSEAERAGYREEQSLAMQSVRFFRWLGVGLTLIGGVGFAFFQI
jgi:hypothetical protein